MNPTAARHAATEVRVLAERLQAPVVSFGALGLTARTPAELRGALDKAIGAGRPSVIHVPVELGEGVSPWKYLMPARGG